MLSALLETHALQLLLQLSFVNLSDEFLLSVVSERHQNVFLQNWRVTEIVLPVCLHPQVCLCNLVSGDNTTEFLLSIGMTALVGLILVQLALFDFSLHQNIKQLQALAEKIFASSVYNCSLVAHTLQITFFVSKNRMDAQSMAFAQNDEKTSSYGNTTLPQNTTSKLLVESEQSAAFGQAIFKVCKKNSYLPCILVPILGQKKPVCFVGGTALHQITIAETMPISFPRDLLWSSKNSILLSQF